MPKAYDDQQTELLTVSICIAPSAMRFGPEPGRRGGRLDCRSGGVAAALAAAQAWLRDAEGNRHPLERRASPRLTSGVLFSASVPPGHYVLCAGPIGTPFRFPPRPVTVERGSTQHTYRLLEGDHPYVRLGSMLVPFGRPSNQFAAVLRPAHSDEPVIEPLLATLGRYGYEPFIDLTRRLTTIECDTVGPEADLAIDNDASAELLVVEFVAKAGTDRPPVGELIRHTGSIAAEAGLAPGGLRLGRLIESPHGPIVVDNEVVLGFTRTIDVEDARRRVLSAGGLIVEDLSDPDAGDLVYVVRFEHAEPEAALEVAESWLAQGVLHWVQPNVVEH